MYGLWLFKELKTEYGYCKIEIFKKSYSSSPIEIEAVEANSLTLSIENLSETISPIGKSVCSFSIVDTGQLSYDDFFTPDATGIKVVISTINEDRGDVAYTTRWSGFVTPDFYSESLVYRTAINISARDNIGYLSDVEFDLAEPSIQIRELFSKAFRKISEQYPMDVMFRSHKTTEDGVLLTDAIISTALFKDKTWGEVLELILHDLGLQMRWIDNNIIAILDLSLLPEFFIPTDFNFVNSSGYREITPAYRQLSQKQDYGVIENFFNGQLNSDNLTFYKKINIATPLQTREEGYNSTLPTISYYTPNNWGVLMKETFTIQPTLYNLTFRDKIWFTGIEDARLFAYTHMSYEQSIYISNKPMTIKFSMLNTIQYPEYGTNKLTTYDPTVGLYIQTGDFLQLGLKCNCILHGEDNKTYILREKWVELSGLETSCIDFILPKVECSQSQGFINEGTAPVEEELTINIATIPVNGILEFRIYGFYIVDKHNYWEDDFDLTKHEIDWTKCVTYIKGLTYTFDTEDISSSQTSLVTINDVHNIKRSEVYKFGEIPANEGAINAYAGGLFHPITFGSLNRFKRNEDSQSYNLLELVGREIIHFNKKNYNKLSGEIKSPTKEPLKFNSLFSREGKLYYPFSCSLNVIDNTMTITSMQEVEPYTTESFTEIHSEVKSDGGTTVSGGNNTVLQYSEEVGNAKRLYEMQDATPAEKEKAFALVDSPDFPQARRIRVADLIGLDEQALAQYLELNKYLQENDLTPITNRIGAVEGYFTNGSAKDALKLGGINAGNYWHKGNSGTLDYDWKAKKLNVRTLVIPTSEPTDLSQGEVGFYLGTAGQGAEEPNGSGGLDLTELWAELGSEDYAKKIHISHIPTIQYSSIAGRPSALVNPYALTINGVVYDGSEPISLDISAGGGVADAVAWANVFNKPSTISGYGITDAYTKDGVDLKLSNYLPKSGGTIEGGSGIYTPLTIKNTSLSEVWIGFQDAYGTCYIGSSNGVPSINMGADNNTLIHSGNYSDYALPISGGTVNGDAYINGGTYTATPLKVNSDTSAITLHLRVRGTNKAEIGWDSSAGAYLYNYTSASYLSVKDDGTPTYNGNTLYHTGNFNPADYLPKSGGTITHQNYGAFELKRNEENYDSVIKFSNLNDGILGYIGISGSATTQAPKTPYYSPNGNTVYPLIHSGNIGSQSVASATKLVTKGGVEYLLANDNDKWVNLAPMTAQLGYNTYVDGNNLYMRYGTSNTVGMLINSSGNILIGTTTDNGDKLQVNGGITTYGSINLHSVGEIQNALAISRYDNGTGYYVGSRNTGLGVADGGCLVYAYGNTPISFYTYGSERMRINGGGNVLIGTTTDWGFNLASIAICSAKTSGYLGNGGGAFFGNIAEGYGTAIWTQGNGNGYIQQGRSNGEAVSYNLVMQHLGGNVLIGTATDNGSKLQVNGGIHSLTGSSYLFGYGTSSATSLSALNNVTAIGAGKDSWNVYIWSFGNGRGCIQASNSNDTTRYALLLQPFGGYVGINTSNPGYSLDVNGTLNAGASTLASLAVTNNAKISGEMDANALVIPTVPPTNPQAGKHYLYLA